MGIVATNNILSSQHVCEAIVIFDTPLTKTHQVRQVILMSLSLYIYRIIWLGMIRIWLASSREDILGVARDAAR
jgi:hypothetical protein